MSEYIADSRRSGWWKWVDIYERTSNKNCII